MPELPDVATFEQHIRTSALHRSIARCQILDTSFLRDISGAKLRRSLEGHELQDTQRHGKLLLLRISGDAGHLELHFGMTGSVAVDPDEPPRHARLQLDFDDGGGLHIISQRKLGHIGLIQDPRRLIEQRGLGPDALSLDREAFEQALGHGARTLKSALMDQSQVAGIGNVYADEICYQSGVHPATPVDKLDDRARVRLYRQMRRVLELAVERSADPQRLPDTWLLSHRQDGARDPRGGGEIRKQRIAGRASYLAPHRQPGP
ncbi:MAG: DNA-formamidopyrimidine glycosylase family protein [Planctomycetota bacterium]